MMTEIKETPEIFDSGEIYVLSQEMEESIRRNNIEYMESKNPIIKKP